MEKTEEPRSTAWQTAVTMLPEIEPRSIPDGAHVMTIVVDYPPGDPGAPRHPARRAGPAAGEESCRDRARDGCRGQRFRRPDGRGCRGSADQRSWETP